MVYKIESGTSGTIVYESDSLRDALATFWELVAEGGDSYTYIGPTLTLLMGDHILKQVQQTDET